MNYCTKCGKKLNENEIICSKCGNTIYNTIEYYHRDKENNEKEDNKYDTHSYHHQKKTDYEFPEDKTTPRILTFIAIAILILSVLGGPTIFFIGIVVSITILLYIAIKYPKSKSATSLLATISAAVLVIILMFFHFLYTCSSPCNVGFDDCDR